MQVLCHTLEVSRSGYYEWLKPAPLSASVEQDAPATEGEKIDNREQIKNIFALHRRRYGTPRLVDEMKDRGIGVSRDFVRKVLADNQLKPIQPRSFVPPTTDSRHTLGYSPNLLLARPRPTGPDQVWVSDITAAADRLHPLGQRQVAVDGRLGRSVVAQGGRLVSGRSHAR